ncbi:UNVERIFIED_CONTAM: hypothetical protein Sradi_1820900 [Sesamum radiatum]|uniref:Uncharacterized protein n=1 Tax=Sesamum radiatum TaxID=300843 RepID=A0AAW2TV69_SESRA
MKRRRVGPRKGAAATTVTNKVIKKNAKGAAAVSQSAKEAVAVEGRREEAEERVPSAEEVAEWAGLWSGVDEEMSWATSWCPFWEMEATGDAYDALFGDVLWDFDIWDLKAIGNAPQNA